MNFFSILQNKKWLEISLKERQKKHWLHVALNLYKECLKDGEFLAIAMLESGLFEKNNRLLIKEDLAGSAEEVLLLCLQATKFTKNGFFGSMFKKNTVDIYSMRTGYLDHINMFFSLLNLENEQRNNYDLFQQLKISLAVCYTLTHSEHIGYYKNLFKSSGMGNIEQLIMEKKEFEQMLIRQLAKNVRPQMVEEANTEFVMIA